MSGIFSSVSSKVFAGYAAVLLVMVVTAVALVNTNRNVQAQVNVFVDVTLPELAALQDLSSAAQSLQLAAFSLYGTTSTAEEFDQSYQTQQGVIKSSIRGLAQADVRLPELRRELDELNRVLGQVRDTMAVKPVDWDAARRQLASLSAKTQSLAQSLTRNTRSVEASASANSEMIVEDLGGVLELIFLLIAVTVAVAGLAYFYSRSRIAQPIKQLSSALTRVAEDHDLTVHLPVRSADEIGQSAESMNNLLSSFHGSLSEVSGAINGISQSVSELGHSSTTSDGVVTELSQTINQLVTVMEQLQQQIESSTSRSESAADIASRGADEVTAGAAEVDKASASISQLADDLETTATMLLALRASGDQVSGVVGTIAEIAGQTNLLALNAAIEAARAGESGRGFAVVADEVRALASKTHQSTVEINSMLEMIVSSITQSVDTMAKNQEQAKGSVSLAQGTVVSLAAIRETIIQLSDECHEVTRLSRDTKAGVAQATSEVGQFQRMGDRVADGSKGVSAAAQSLTQLATGLSEQVARFKL